MTRVLLLACALMALAPVARGDGVSEACRATVCFYQRLGCKSSGLAESNADNALCKKSEDDKSVVQKCGDTSCLVVESGGRCGTLDETSRAQGLPALNTCFDGTDGTNQFSAVVTKLEDRRSGSGFNTALFFIYAGLFFLGWWFLFVPLIRKILNWSLVSREGKTLLGQYMVCYEISLPGGKNWWTTMHPNLRKNLRWTNFFYLLFYYYFFAEAGNTSTSGFRKNDLL